MTDGVSADLVDKANEWLSHAAEMRQDKDARMRVGTLKADARAEAFEECARDLLALALDNAS
jgi:hypothetical protein